MWGFWSYCPFIFCSLLIRSGDGFIPSRCAQTHLCTQSPPMTDQHGQQNSAFTGTTYTLIALTWAWTIWMAWSCFSLPASQSQSLVVDFILTHTHSQGSLSGGFCILRLWPCKQDARRHVAPAHYSLGTLTQPLTLTSHVTIPGGWLKMLWHSASTCAMGHAALLNHCINSCYGPRPSRNGQALLLSFRHTLLRPPRPKWQLSQWHWAPTQTQTTILNTHRRKNAYHHVCATLASSGKKAVYVTQGSDSVWPHGSSLLFLLKAS